MPYIKRRAIGWLSFTIAALVALVVLLYAHFAHATEPTKPLPSLTCEDVRRIVAEQGKIKALALAIENGATWRQLREARKCLSR